MAKSWTEKFHNGREPVVEEVTKTIWGHGPGSKMLISTPAEVANAVAEITKGSFMTLPELRVKLARDHGADLTCPMTASIFLRIAAEVAWDEFQDGKSDVTPFWRVIAPNEPLAKKLRCGPEFIATQRKNEGIP